MKYAIKLMLSKDDWIYVTEDTGGNCWDLTVRTFDDIKDAERFAEVFTIEGRESNVRVVEYTR